MKYNLAGIVFVFFVLCLSSSLCFSQGEDEFSLVVLKGKVVFKNAEGIECPLLENKIPPNALLMLHPYTHCVILFQDASYQYLQNDSNTIRTASMLQIKRDWGKSSSQLYFEQKGNTRVLLDLVNSQATSSEKFKKLVLAPDPSRCPPPIHIYRRFEFKDTVFGEQLIFQWTNHNGKCCKFPIRVMNNFGDNYFSGLLNTEITTLKFDYKREKIFVINVACSCEETCGSADEIRIFSMGPFKREQLRKRIELAYDDSYWESLLHAMLFEDERLFLDAFTKYKVIQKEFPDYNELTKYLLINYLKRSGIAVDEGQGYDPIDLNIVH